MIFFSYFQDFLLFSRLFQEADAKSSSVGGLYKLEEELFRYLLWQSNSQVKDGEWGLGRYFGSQST